jgi:hypothetical protein
MTGNIHMERGIGKAYLYFVIWENSVRWGARFSCGMRLG